MVLMLGKAKASAKNGQMPKGCGYTVATGQRLLFNPKLGTMSRNLVHVKRGKNSWSRLSNLPGRSDVLLIQICEVMERYLRRQNVHSQNQQHDEVKTKGPCLSCSLAFRLPHRWRGGSGCPVDTFFQERLKCEHLRAQECQQAGQAGHPSPGMEKTLSLQTPLRYTQIHRYKQPDKRMKHSMKWSAAIFAAGLVLCSPAAAEQKGAATAPATKTTPTAAAEKDAKPKRDTYPLYGEVVSINATTLVIKGGVDKPNRTFVLSKDTEIVDGDKAAKVSDVKTGHWWEA